MTDPRQHRTRIPLGAAAKPPPLRCATVYLRPIAPRDYEMLRIAELSEHLGVLWRFRGTTPSPEAWAQNLLHGNVLAQFLVIDNESDEPVALVSAFAASLQDGFCSIGIATLRTSVKPLRTLAGATLFINYLFRTWNMRKLYVETLEYNLRRFSSGVGRLFTLEGCQREHMYYDGRYWDRYLLAIYRADWVAVQERYLAAIQASSSEDGKE